MDAEKNERISCVYCQMLYKARYENNCPFCKNLKVIFVAVKSIDKINIASEEKKIKKELEDVRKKLPKPENTSPEKLKEAYESARELHIEAFKKSIVYNFSNKEIRDEIYRFDDKLKELLQTTPLKSTEVLAPAISTPAKPIDVIRTVSDIWAENYTIYDKLNYLYEHYNDSFSYMLDFLMLDKVEYPKIIDIGAGTGELVYKMILRFPKAIITALDVSEKMLNVIKNKVNQFQDRLITMQKDFTTDEITGMYNAIFLTSVMQFNNINLEKFYKKMYDILLNKGMLFVADYFKESSNELKERANDLDVGDKSILNECNNALTEKINREIKQKLDELIKLEPMEKHIDAMQKSGFLDIDCIYKKYNFSVICGIKK